MPIYEYLCEACGRITEVMQKVSDPSPGSCPECGSNKIAKLVSRSAFQLKGGGWYADLYSSPKKGGEAGRGDAHEKPKAAPAGEPSSAAKPPDAKKPVPAKPAAE